MTLTPPQKRWAIGGGIGAVALAIGYALFHSRPALGAPPPHQLHAPEHHKHKRKKHPHARHDGGNDHGESDRRENGRGEYGDGHKHRHHKGRKHD